LYWTHRGIPLRWAGK